MARSKPPLQWPPIKRRSAPLRALDRARRWGRRWSGQLIFAAVIAGLVLTWYSNRNVPHEPSSVFTPQIPEVALPRNPFWERPAKAPNESPWPAESDYIAGYPRLNVFGLAQVVADNSGGRSDLFVKLIDRDQKPMKAVRVFFLRAKDRLRLAHVKPGHYDVRYKNLDSGRIRRSGAFEVTLKETGKGSEYMGWTIGLYDVLNGNAQHDDITEKDF